MEKVRLARLCGPSGQFVTDACVLRHLLSASWVFLLAFARPCILYAGELGLASAREGGVLSASLAMHCEHQGGCGVVT